VQILFNNISFLADAKDRIRLVGKNSAETPIILKVIDEESVAGSKPSGCTGYLYRGVKPKLVRPF
jgi:hypothetical protein